MDSYAVKEVNEFDVTPTQKFGSKEEPASFQRNTAQKEQSEVNKAPASLAGNGDQKEKPEQNKEPQSQIKPQSSPTKRDGDIEEF